MSEDNKEEEKTKKALKIELDAIISDMEQKRNRLKDLKQEVADW